MLTWPFASLVLLPVSVSTVSHRISGLEQRLGHRLILRSRGGRGINLTSEGRTFKAIAERWEAAGKVPRDRIKELEGRIRKVEQEIRKVEDEQWRRTDPEKSARADDMVSKLEAALAAIQADLDAARSAGDEKKVRELEENLASRQAFLDMARRASADFS